MPVNNNAYTPRETTELIGRSGVIRANMRIDKIFLSAVMAGMLISFSCATVLTANTAPWYQDNAPGLIRCISALLFPYGLAMVVITGCDLFTGSIMFTIVPVLQRRLSLARMLMHWTLTFFGNLAGCLFVAMVITGYGGTFSDSAYRTEVQSFAKTKQITPQWHQIFLRAIGANWLVCLSMFLATAGRENVSKLVGLWWPAFAFVSLGFDHVVANMFFIPTAIFVGTENLTVGLYIWKGIIPGAIGNIVGGSLFVGCFMWYLHLEGVGGVEVDGDAYDDVVHGQQLSRRGILTFRMKRRPEEIEKGEDEPMGI